MRAHAHVNRMAASMKMINAKVVSSFSNYLIRLGPCRFKSFNSTEWMERHKKDPYVGKAKEMNFRCRSAFKLIEMDDKYKFIKPGFSVVDIGAAPGSWSQVLSARTNSNRKDGDRPVGLVIAIDKTFMYPIEGVTLMVNSDFTVPETRARVRDTLAESGRSLDFVLSDMAPQATGVKSLDQEKIVSLAYPVVAFALENLRPGGGCLIKLWEGQHGPLVDNVKRFFKTVNVVKPKATYATSSELYILARDFVGVKKAH